MGEIKLCTRKLEYFYLMKWCSYRTKTKEWKTNQCTSKKYFKAKLLPVCLMKSENREREQRITGSTLQNSQPSCDSDSNSRKCILSSPAAPDLLQRHPSSLLFPVLSQKLSFILTVKAGIGNALVHCRQGGRHLTDLISSHIGLVWLRMGEEMRQVFFRAPQHPVEL